jgi:hypothetical protein
MASKKRMVVWLTNLDGRASLLTGRAAQVQTGGQASRDAQPFTAGRQRHGRSVHQQIAALPPVSRNTNRALAVVRDFVGVGPDAVDAGPDGFR